MTALKTKPTADTTPDIKITSRKTAYKHTRMVHNRICGIGLILLGAVSIAIQTDTGTSDGKASIMLFLMGLAAFVGNN